MVAGKWWNGVGVEVVKSKNFVLRRNIICCYLPPGSLQSVRPSVTLLGSAKTVRDSASVTIGS